MVEPRHSLDTVFFITVQDQQNRCFIDLAWVKQPVVVNRDIFKNMI